MLDTAIQNGARSTPLRTASTQQSTLRNHAAGDHPSLMSAGTSRNFSLGISVESSFRNLPKSTSARPFRCASRSTQPLNRLKAQKAAKNNKVWQSMGISSVPVLLAYQADSSVRGLSRKMRATILSGCARSLADGLAPGLKQTAPPLICLKRTKATAPLIKLSSAKAPCSTRKDSRPGALTY